jgi:putative transposase
VSQYVSHDFQAEIRFLGLESSPAFVRGPEGNGCAERFIRTLKENLLWVQRFETVEELRLVVRRRRKIPAGHATSAHSGEAAGTVRRYQLPASHH